MTLGIHFYINTMDIKKMPQVYHKVSPVISNLVNITNIYFILDPIIIHNNNNKHLNREVPWNIQNVSH